MKTATLCKSISLLPLFMIFSFLSHAQQKELMVKVTDSINRQPLKGVSLSLWKNDDKIIAKGITNDSGIYVFNSLYDDAYLIKASAVGFNEGSGVASFEKANHIMLQRKGTELSGVTLVSKGSPVTQKGDTAQYAASQYQVNPDATTEDLIRKMPGITVDKSGTVTAQGEQVKKVTVDGKDFFGDDATAAIKNLPANVVDKIQVFDRLSDQAQLTGIDDGNTQKTINIITKAGIQNAQFGRVYAGAGNDSRYSGGGNVSFFKNERRLSFIGNFNNINQQNFGSQDLLGVTGSSNQNRYPGGGMSGGRGGSMGGSSESFTIGPSNGISTTNAIGVNYGDKWGNRTTVTGSYFFNNNNNNNSGLTHTTILEGNQNTLQQSEATSNNNNHRVNARLEIKLDSNNMLFVIPNLSFQTNNTGKSGLFESYKNLGDSLYNTHSNTENDKTGYNLRNNLLFRHTFKRKGRLFSAGFNTTFTKNDGISDINGIYRFYDDAGLPLLPDSLQKQNSNNKTSGYTLSGNISYNEPLDKEGKSQLQLEYNPSFQRSQSDQATYSYDGNQYTKFDTLLSNKFSNDIITHNGGITYRLSRTKDVQFAIGISYQETQLKSFRTFPSNTSVDQAFRNFLPNANWRKKISKYANIRMFYRASTIFPSINQLQDVVNLSNPLNVSSGNKDLKQSYTHYLGGRYTYTNTKTGKSIFGGLFFQHSSNFISNATYIIQSDSSIQQGIVLKKGSQFSKPVNLDGYRLLRTFFTYSIPVKLLKTNISLNAVLVYSNLPGMVNYVKTSTENYQYTLGTVLSSNINEYVDYNITYNANINKSNTRGSTVTNNNYVNHSLSATLNLLSKKGWFISNDLSYQSYQGLTGGFNQTFTLWNASIGKKFLKNKVAEFKLSVFDILKQNQSISRNISNTYIEDVQSKVLQQYFMATFSYNLKNFGKPKKPTTQSEEFITPVGYPSRY